MATITKRELINDLSNQTGLKQQEVANLVDAFIDLLGKRLGEGHHVTFRTFGTFEIRVAKAKIGRNPNNPEAEVRIPDRCVVRFKPGRELKNGIASLPPEKVIASDGA
jgi:nucleoid DNA-binding protein